MKKHLAYTFPNVLFPNPPGTALVRSHQVTNDSFREAKLPRPLSGGEPEKWTDVSHPYL
ncbi:MAG: hypothetical protein HGA71_15040 [Azonexaceae bacterium]|nr:hypothetical protein [Azonexaceae bacterium]